MYIYEALRYILNCSDLALPAVAFNRILSIITRHNEGAVGSSAQNVFSLCAGASNLKLCSASSGI